MAWKVRVASALVAVLWCGEADAQSRAPDASATGGAVVVGSYSVSATQLRAVVYRPASPIGPSPLILMMHGNHAVCGKPYDPAPLGPDPVGLPCTRPPGGGACKEGIRIDIWNYTSPTTRDCGGAPFTEAPSYLGFEYIGRRLASQGYVVASIDANLVNARTNSGPAGDTQLILARGALVLQHLEQLSAWARNGGAPEGAEIAKGSLDLRHVGLMGHSRGGEAMRAAYNAYIANGSAWPARVVTPVTFDGIFEIAPTDFRGLNASGVPWTVLLPMCDADVIDEQGVRAFDRSMADFAENPPAQKSTHAVWGANHEFFNSQWMVSDTFGLRPLAGGATEVYNAYPCRGAGNAPLFPLAPGSASQRLTALSSIAALVRGNVGATADRTFNENFNTLFALPATVTNEGNTTSAYPTRTDRGYSPTASRTEIRVVEDFDRATGLNTSGQANAASGIVINHLNGGWPTVSHGTIPNHDPGLRGAYIQWDAASAAVMFQANWTSATAPGVDVSPYTTLDFRVSRNADPVRNTSPTDFSVRLIGANGVMTRQVRVSAYAAVANDLRGPVGGGSMADPNRPLLQTYRIPLADFGNVALVGRQVRGVRFTFDQTSKGAIFLANIRFVRTWGAGVTSAPASASLTAGPSLAAAAGVEPVQVPVVYAGQVMRVRHFAALAALNGEGGVEVQIYSPVNFPIRDAATVLVIGDQSFTASRYPGVDTNNLIFTLTEAQWAGLKDGDAVRVQYGTHNTVESWACGALDKGQLTF